MIIGAVLFVLGALGGSKSKQEVKTSVPTTVQQQWGARCPNCETVNLGEIDTMRDRIICGKCNVGFIPDSIDKIGQ